jgi:hypothetical protein
MVAMSQSGQEKQPRTHLVGTLPTTITSVALIVTVLLVAGCGRTTTLAGTSGPHATAMPTSTSQPHATATLTSAILPGAPLSWTAGNLPPFSPFIWGEMVGHSLLWSFYIDPGDGNIAYTCAPSASSPVGMAIWATHDRAQKWSQLAPLPSGTRQLDACMIVPDAADPSIVVVAVSWVRLKDLFQEPPPVLISDVAQLVTFDGGAHWQPLHGPQPFLLQWLATYHGTTLAMLENDSGSIHLWSSTDQMQTWHELPQAPYGQPWINPVTGNLLVLDINGNNQGYVYESSDLGQHWTSLPMPSDLLTVPLLVSPPVAGQPWRICVISATGTLMCSMDSGRTWTSRPQLTTTFDNTDKGIVVPETAQEVAVGADGTVYAVIGYDQQPMGGIPSGLYQLTPQATRWQPLTSPPGGAVATTDIPGIRDSLGNTERARRGGRGWAISGCLRVAARASCACAGIGVVTEQCCSCCGWVLQYYYRS